MHRLDPGELNSAPYILQRYTYSSQRFPSLPAGPRHRVHVPYLLFAPRRGGARETTRPIACRCTRRWGCGPCTSRSPARPALGALGLHRQAPPVPPREGPGHRLHHDPGPPSRPLQHVLTEPLRLPTRGLDPGRFGRALGGQSPVSHCTASATVIRDSPDSAESASTSAIVRADSPSHTTLPVLTG